jgi:hypothetical protein
MQIRELIIFFENTKKLVQFGNTLENLFILAKNLFAEKFRGMNATCLAYNVLHCLLVSYRRAQILKQFRSVKGTFYLFL